MSHNDFRSIKGFVSPKSTKSILKKVLESRPRTAWGSRPASPDIRANGHGGDLTRVGEKLPHTLWTLWKISLSFESQVMIGKRLRKDAKGYRRSSSTIPFGITMQGDGIQRLAINQTARFAKEYKAYQNVLRIAAAHVGAPGGQWAWQRPTDGDGPREHHDDGGSWDERPDF